MSGISTFDGLLAQVWQHAISILRNNLRDEFSPTLVSTWVVSVLLKAELSPKEPEIRDYLTQLDNWVEQMEVETGVLDESPTGLLGLWIHLRHQQRKRVKDHLEDLFLRSVEHNLQKPKNLSLGTSVDLLTAVAAGLGSTSRAAELQTKTSERLQTLSQNASALELVQMIESWELIQRTGDIPRMAVQHKLESIVANENSTIIERAMAYYGQLRLAELFDKPSIEHEMRFLGCLAVVACSDQVEGGAKTKAYVLSLPYLRLKTSYNSLFDAWQRYADARLKRAQTENYLFRYLGLLIIAGLGAYSVAWSWFLHLDLAKQIPLAIAVVSLVLAASYFTAQKVLALHGRQFWERSDVKLSFAVMEAILSVVAAAALALAQ